MQLDISTGSSLDMYERLDEKVMQLNQQVVFLCRIQLGKLELPSRFLSSMLTLRIDQRNKSGPAKRFDRVLRIIHIGITSMLVLTLTAALAFEVYVLRTHGDSLTLLPVRFVLLLVKIQGRSVDQNMRS